MLVVKRKNLAYLITIKYSVERSPFPMRFRCFLAKVVGKNRIQASKSRCQIDCANGLRRRRRFAHIFLLKS